LRRAVISPIFVGGIYCFNDVVAIGHEVDPKIDPLVALCVTFMAGFRLSR